MEKSLVMKRSKSYSGMLGAEGFVERYHYLKIGGKVGAETFGSDRYFNQRFYNSAEWKRTRDFVITRDAGCDMAVAEREIGGQILVHHIVPIDLEDIVQGSDLLLDPDNLVCVSHGTHNAIHYGDESQLEHILIERLPGDTRLW